MAYPCKVRDGKFVDPCTSLEGAMFGSPFGRGNGLFLYDLSNLKTGKPTRSFVVLRTGKNSERGVALNCCPFCGERIDAPFSEVDQLSESAA